ncbi:MAG: DUF4349 domain-containing protein [Methanoregula sp.]|jgi:hypothetical protein|uniref:DUF4349 domain-containing protein n=1 Tax=Methanoregula sp. TaxID=2052170 RepID=UPI003C254FDF
MNYKVIALLVVCIALAAAAGCTGLPIGTFVKTQSSQDVARVSSDSNGYSLLQEKTVSAGSSAAPAVAPVPTSISSGTGGTGIDTKIIKTADVTLEVRDVTGTVDSLKGLAIAQGGYLSSTTIQKNYNNQLTGTVIIRIPQDGFDNAIAGVKALGTVKSISTSGQDVTEEYVDLQAQKTSYTNQLAQYNVIMKQSTKVEDIIKVQEQIDQVQTELDRLNGRLNYLNNRIDISTITVYLQEPEPVGGQTGHDFIATINEGISGFFGMIDTIIILLFTFLPLIILGAIGYGVYRWHKGKKAVEPATREERK